LTHNHAPCIKNPALLHAIADRGYMTENTNAILHSAEGCGNCPKNLGACAILNSIGKDQITVQQRSAIVSRLTA
jgi:hypothetical protein